MQGRKRKIEAVESWTAEELEKYEEADLLYPKNWTKMSQMIGTKSASQVKNRAAQVKRDKQRVIVKSIMLPWLQTPYEIDKDDFKTFIDNSLENKTHPSEIEETKLKTQTQEVQTVLHNNPPPITNTLDYSKLYRYVISLFDHVDRYHSKKLFDELNKDEKNLLQSCLHNLFENFDKTSLFDKMKDELSKEKEEEKYTLVASLVPVHLSTTENNNNNNNLGR